MIDPALKRFILAAGLAAFPVFTCVAAEQGSVFDVDIPALEVAAPPYVLTVRGGGSEACEDFSEKLEAMETSILDTKARYWAHRALEGRISGLISNPGSEIRNPALRRQFYDLFNYHHANAGLRGLSAFESQALKATMLRMLRLSNECGLHAPELRRAIRQTFG